MTVSMTINRGRKIDVEVQLAYTPPVRGHRDSLGGIANAGPPLEPDEPGFWTIESCHDLAGNPYDLTPLEEETAHEIADTMIGAQFL